MKPILYHNDMSVCAQKVRIVLEEKGVGYEERHLSLMKNEAKTEAYLKINPKGVVPSIVYDGMPIVESTVICEFVEDAFDGPQLSPPDPVERAKMRWWTRQLDEDIHRATMLLCISAAFRHQGRAHYSPEKLQEGAKSPNAEQAAWFRTLIEITEQGIDAPVVRPAIKRFDRMLNEMEAALNKKEWLASESYSLADASFTSYVNRLYQLQLHNWWADKPKVTAWFERVKTRPSYAKGVEAWSNPDYLELFKTHGAEAWPSIKAQIAA